MATQPLAQIVRAGPTLAEKVPAALRARLEAGECLIIAGRASTSGGIGGRTDAINNLYQANELARAHGIDSGPVPDSGSLALGMKVESKRVLGTRADGKTIPLHLLEIEPRPGVVLVIVQGTGSAITDDDVQLSAREFRRLIRARHPALLVVTEVRTIVRDGAAFGEVRLAMRGNRGRDDTPMWYCDRPNGLKPWDRSLEAALSAQAEDASLEADTTSSRTIAGARQRTGKTEAHGVPLRPGQITFHFGFAVPPPLATAELVSPNGLEQGERIAYFDTSLSRPQPGEAVERGRPSILRDTGHGPQPVDQLEIARFFFRWFGHLGWGYRAMAEKLLQLGLCTEGSRRARKTLDGQPMLRLDPYHRDDARRICHMFIDQMDWHVTGLLKVPLGENGAKVDMRFAPPDGKPVCTALDRDRIKAYLHARMPRQPRKGPPAVLSGHEARINGRKGELLMVRDRKTRAVQFQFVRGHEAPRPNRRHLLRSPRNSPVPPIRFAAFLEAFGETLRERVTLFPVLPEPDEARTHAEAALEACLIEQREAADASAYYFTLLTKQRPEPGTKLLTDLLAKRQEADESEAAARAQAALWRQQLDVGPAERAGVPIQRILDFLADLRNPFTPQIREMLRANLAPMEATTARVDEGGGRASTRLTVNTTLRVLDQDGEPWDLPIKWTQETRRMRRADVVVADVVHAMRQGTPFRDSVGRPWPRRAVAMALGHAKGESCPLTRVLDPDLLSLSMAICHPEPRHANAERPGGLSLRPLRGQRLRDLAERAHVPLTLMHHLLGLHEAASRSRPGPWRTPRRPALAAVLAQAARRPMTKASIVQALPWRQGWRELVEPSIDGNLMTKACPYCGSRNRVTARIREISGLLCLDCRRDERGHRWSANPYDSYLDLP